MLKHFWIVFTAFILSSVLFACSSSGGGSGSTSYKYQISGTTPFIASAQRASAFVLQWNEDANGNITGIFTDDSTGDVVSVTGTSDGSGRIINGAINPPVNGVSTIRFVIAQTGDLNGAVSATLKTLDANGAELSSQAVTVEATTAGSGGGNGGGGNGGGGNGNGGGSNNGGGNSGGSNNGGGSSAVIGDYIGVYVGSATELTNTNVGFAVGNGKYCDFSFSGVDLRFELSNYVLFGYSTKFTNGSGAYEDATGADPANLNITLNQGFPSATLMDAGYHDTGVKITAADQSGGKHLTFQFVGAFAGTSTKTLTGTLTAKLNSTDICSFSINMTKQ